MHLAEVGEDLAAEPALDDLGVLVLHRQLEAVAQIAHDLVAAGVDQRALHLAMCVLRSALTPTEALLIDSGHLDSVHDQRQAFEQTLGPALRAAVERITARTVTSFLPTTHLAPSLTLLAFGFARAASPSS